MKILFLTKGDRTVASSRQRIWLVADYLKDQFGVESEVLWGYYGPFWNLSVHRFKMLFKAWQALRQSYDIIFVHKSFISWEVVVLLITARRVFGRRLVYDLDDAQWLYAGLKSRVLAKNADVIFCGSHAILKWAEVINKNSMFVPTVVDGELYSSYSADYGNRSDIVTIGWVGNGRAHFKVGNFAVVKEALADFKSLGYNFRFVIVGSNNYTPLKNFFSNVNFEVIYIDEADWTDSETVPFLINKFAFDIGLMPISSTPFNRAKCAFKAIEYMACGVPAVASRVGEAEYLIDDGVDGFLAESDAEWLEALAALARDNELRRRMGREAQKKIREKYSLQSILPGIRQILKDLSEKQK